MNKKIVLIALALVTNTCGCKKEPLKEVKTDNPLVTATDKTVDEAARPFAQRKEIIGFSIGILQNGRRQFYNYGEKARDGGLLPDSLTSYEIGSVSKTFTALMVAHLFQATHLSLDTRVSSLLPASIPPLQYNGRYMTVKHLLNHTSSLPRLPGDLDAGSNPAQPYAHYDSTKVYNYLKTHPLQKEPGTVFDYSNLGMGLAGLIVERLSGKAYADYLNDYITSPLNLKYTTADFSKALNPALPYDEKGRKVDYWNNLQGFKGAGAIYSCTADLLTYAQKLIQPDATPLSDILTRVQIPTFSEGKYKLGLSWFFLPFNGKECLVHDGGTGGFRSFIYISRSTNTAVVVLSNNGSDEMAKFANVLAETIMR